MLPLYAAHLDSDGSNGRPVVIDLSECDYIDSAGIALIVEAWRSRNGANGNGGARGRVGLTLAAPSGQVNRVFGITGLADLISVCGEVEQALAAVETFVQERPTPA